MNLRIFLNNVIILFIINFIPGISLSSITPGKWNYKDSLVLFPSESAPKPIREKVYNNQNQLVLISELIYDGHYLIKEIYKNPSQSIEGYAEYIYKNGKISRETIKDEKGIIVDSKEYSYKGNEISKIRFFTKNGELYMDTTVFQWMDGMIASGEILWMETKDKEKILITSSDKKRTMTIYDEKKQPLATVDFIYDDKGNLKERIFQQNDTYRKNLFDYDSQGRLIQFSFHVKQNGNWVLEKKHILEYE